jgi:hypothetical protein
MRRTWIVALAASATLGLSAPELNAQGAGRGNAQAQAAQQQQAERDRLRAERQRQAERERLRAEQERQAAARAWNDRQRPGQQARGQQARGQQGPAFCRNGQGHPVHGRQWCQQKGFGLGSERWDRARWDDIIFGQPRDRRRYDDGSVMNRGTLADILGNVVLGRFEAQGRQRGGGAVTGQWLAGVDGRILQLSVGGQPFAQLVDSRGNGRVDTVLLRR